MKERFHHIAVSNVTDTKLSIAYTTPYLLKNVTEMKYYLGKRILKKSRKRLFLNQNIVLKSEGFGECM